jgi:hypothetical protein
MLAWLATAGVGVAAGGTLWKIVKNFRGGAYLATTTSHFAEVISGSLGTIPSSDIKIAGWNEYTKLVTCPINGFVPPEPTVAAAPSAPQPVSKQKIEDALKLKVVTFAPDEKGRVIVEYKDDSVTSAATKDEIVLAVNSRLAGKYADEPFNATLKEIKPNTAIFDWCGETVELHPVRREEVRNDKPAVAAGEQKGLSDQDKADLEKHKDSAATINLGNERYLVGTTDQDAIGKNGDKFLGELRVAERPGANKKPEVVLSNVRPNSHIARTYGVQAEDVLVSINGTAVSSKSQGYQYVRDNPDLPRYDVVIRRAGKEITKTILVNRKK